MSSTLRSIITSTVVVGGVLFGGWTLMTFLSPSKEQMMERLSLDPDENIAASKKRNRQLFQAIQQNIQSPDPVWKVKPLEDKKKDSVAEAKDNEN